jgi:hypothetical protein
MLRRRRFSFPVVASLMLGGAVALAGCARTRAVPRGPDRPVAAAIRALEPRVDVVLGRRLVMPVEVQGTIDARKQVTVRLEDGRRLTAHLYWLSARVDGRRQEWMPPVGRWSITPASADRLPTGTGIWVVAVDLPLDAQGQGLWINDTRVALNWLPDPGSLGAEAEAWRPPLGEVSPNSPLMRMAREEVENPLRRWRYGLLLNGLQPESRPPLELDLGEPAAGLGDAHFEDPVLEALARQTEARWQVALGNLWLASPAVAEQLKRRLVAAVDFGAFGGGPRIAAPAWPTSQEDMDALLGHLLNPRVSGAMHVERTVAWLDSQPAAAAWVMDDSGLRDAQSGRPVGLFGIANLTERATLAWATVGSWSEAVGLTTVEGLSLAQVAVAAPETRKPAQPGPAEATEVQLHAGKWATSRRIIWSPLPARPPGLRIEPLLRDWTMLAWLNGEPDATMVPEPEWATAALLYRAAIENSEGLSEDRWMLLVEARGIWGEATSIDAESVRIWLGPTGSPTAVLKGTGSGLLLEERAPDQGLRGELRGAQVVRSDGKWIMQVPVPARCIESDGTLRIGMERIDARGQRSAWPRPMMPWQTEPGRVAVDTNAWGGIESRVER